MLLLTVHVAVGEVLLLHDFFVLIFIDHVAGEIIRLVASVCVRVCPSICLWALSCLNCLTLVFDMRVDLDLG